MSYYDATWRPVARWVPVRLMSMDPAQAERIVQAALENIESWERRLSEIESNEACGNKARVLSLLRDVAQVRVSLRRLAGLADE
jgi:hypothetical protein